MVKGQKSFHESSKSASVLQDDKNSEAPSKN